MREKDKRRESRFRYRIDIFYERMISANEFGSSVATRAKDIGVRGVGFYSSEELPLGSSVRITFFISEKDKISYVGRVRRMEISDDPAMKFVVGVESESIRDEDVELIGKFLKRRDIYTILDKIELSDVVDINLVSGYPPVIKKIGSLVFTDMEPLDEKVLRNMLLNMLDEDRYNKFIATKEINFVFSYRDKARIRTNLHIQQGKVEGTLRLIPNTVSLPSEIGLPPVVDKMLENKKGLILVAGRTGSGKSTTLSSMVEYLNQKRNGIIVTIEDPVEYLHTNVKCIIKQREVGRDTISYSSAARNALRQNPDVLLIGEILDTESMEVAITAAESGVLVLTSIHASNSSQALDRVASFFPPELQKFVLSRVALTLRCVITQDLVPRADGKGLVVATEVLVINDAMRRIVRAADWQQIPTAIIGGRNIGMQSMQDSLEQFYNYGLIDGEYLKGYVA